MEKETILRKIKPFLINNAEITEENFELVFSAFSQKEKYCICEVLESQNIEIIYEEETEENRVSEEPSSFDESLILDKVIPLLSNKDEIYELDFENLFQTLSQKEKYEVLAILEKNNISLVYETHQEQNIDDAINFDFVFQRISPFITKNNWILKSKFDEIFSFLPKNELEKINDYLTDKGIRLIDEKDKEYTENNYDYIEDDKDYSSLSIEMLCGLYQKGNKSVLKDIYQKTEKLVYSRSLHFIKYFNHTLNFEDITQYGYFGLHKAIETYDSSYDTSFSTHAVQWIDQSIRRNIIDKGFMIRLPAYIFNEISTVLKLAKEFKVDNLNDISKYIDFEITDYDLKKINKSIEIISNFLNLQSLNIKIGNEDAHELLDIFGGDNKWDPERITNTNSQKCEIMQVLGELKPKYRDVLLYRYGLFDYPKKSLEEIGKEMNITRERVRQIQIKALERLRKNTKIKHLKIYLEDN